METVHHTEAAFQAAQDCGFRTTIGKAMMDSWEPGTEMIGEDSASALAESLRLLDQYHGTANGRIRYGFCPRGVRNASDKLWKEVRNLAAQRQVVIHSHALENQNQADRLQQAYGQRDIQYLHSLQVTGPNLILAHCVWVTPEDIRLLAETGTCVAHCPSANLKLASGFAPVPEMLDAGVTVALGADGAPCNNNLDIFHELRFAALIHKPRKGPKAMPALRVLEMATINGARALGLEHELGSLEAGKKADITMLRRDGLHTHPNLDVDPVAQVVYAHKSSDVDTVIIDGRVVMRNRELTLLDENELRTRANQSIERLLNKAQLSPLRH